MDPLAYRIEPLLAPEFSHIPAVCIPRLRAHTIVHEHITASYQGIFAESEKHTSTGPDVPPLNRQPDSAPSPSLEQQPSDMQPIASSGATQVTTTAGDKGV